MADRYQAWAAALALGVMLAGLAAAAEAQGFGGVAAVFRPKAAPPVPRSAASAADQGDYAPGLRVVVTGRQRAVASIDGRLVHVGDEINGMRVVRIDAHGVVLAGDEGANERLTLAPAAQKQPLAMQPGAKGAKR